MRINKNAAAATIFAILTAPVSPIYLLYVFALNRRARAYQISLIVAICSFLLMLGYERLNQSGDITRYLQMYEYACVPDNYFNAYTLAYLGWYLSLRGSCINGIGFDVLSASLIFLGYFALFRAVYCIRQPKKLEIIIIIYLLLCYNYVNVFSSYRTSVALCLIAPFLLEKLTYKDNKKLSIILAIFGASLHFFALGLVMLAFGIIILSSKGYLRKVFFLAAIIISVLFLLQSQFIISKVATYVFGEFSSFDLSTNSEIIKLYLVAVRFLVFSFFLVLSFNHLKLYPNYFWFLFSLCVISLISRTIAVRVFIDGWIFFVVAILYYLENSKSNFNKIILSFALIMTVDLRSFKVTSDAYHFSFEKFILPLANLYF